MTLRTLQIVAILTVVALLFLSRRTRGHARPTPDGLAFAIKPVVLVARVLAVAVYFFLFAYPLWISRQSIPAWLLILLLVAILYGLYQLPGTIVLTPDAVLQRFWLRASRQIPYARIARVAGSPCAQITRIWSQPSASGRAPTLIVHSFNHVDGATFRSELAARSGKPLSTT